MVAPAAIPVDRGGRLGEDRDLRLVSAEIAVLEDEDLAGRRVQHGEQDPAVAAHPADPLVPVHDPEHRLGGRLDEEDGPDRLVDLDHLPGQAGPQVARRAVHHPEHRRQVVRQLRAGPVAVVVDPRKVVFEVDPGADREDGAEDPRQDRVLGVVLGRVVRREERPAVEEQAAGPLPPPHNRDGVRGLAEFGPSLSQVFRALLDMLPRRGKRQSQRRRHEPPAALVRVPLAGRLDDGPDPVEFLPVRPRGPDRRRSR